MLFRYCWHNMTNHVPTISLMLAFFGFSNWHLVFETCFAYFIQGGRNDEEIFRSHSSCLTYRWRTAGVFFTLHTTTPTAQAKQHRVIHVVEHAITDTVQEFHPPNMSLGDVVGFP